MNGEYDEAYDDSVESAFEDLEYDESRRRRGRDRGGRGRGRGASRVPVPSAPSPYQRPEAAANRMRDRQLARAINGTAEDVSDVESRINRANADIGRLKQLALVSLIMPRTPEVTRQRFQVRAVHGGAPVLEPTNNPVGPGVVELTTNVGSRLEMMPILAFMMMSRGIGTGGRGTAAAAANDNMMPMVLMLMVMQQQQQQQAAAAAAAGGAPAAPAPAGGMDTTMLLMLMMAMGSL